MKKDGKEVVIFKGIDYWSRPVFQTTSFTPTHYIGSVEITVDNKWFEGGISPEAGVLSHLKETDLVYFYTGGSAYDECDPHGSSITASIIIMSHSEYEKVKAENEKQT